MLIWQLPETISNCLPLQNTFRNDKLMGMTSFRWTGHYQICDCKCLIQLWLVTTYTIYQFYYMTFFSENYTLQAGNNCFLSVYGVHRHEIWGKDADQFRPERWLEKQLPSNPNAFIPFSIGKRNCIGKHQV